jgi:hypothetical protein
VVRAPGAWRRCSELSRRTWTCTLTKPKPPQSRLNPSQWPSEYVRPPPSPPPKLCLAQLLRRQRGPARNGSPEMKIQKTDLSPSHSAALPSSSTGPSSPRSSVSRAKPPPRSKPSRSATTMRAASWPSSPSSRRRSTLPTTVASSRTRPSSTTSRSSSTHSSPRHTM